MAKEILANHALEGANSMRKYLISFPRIPAWGNMGIRAHFFAKRKIRWQKVNFNISLAILRGDYQFRALFGLGKRRQSAFPSPPPEKRFICNTAQSLLFPFLFPMSYFLAPLSAASPKLKGSFLVGGRAAKGRETQCELYRRKRRIHQLLHFALHSYFNVFWYFGGKTIAYFTNYHIGECYTGAHTQESGWAEGVKFYLSRFLKLIEGGCCKGSEEEERRKKPLKSAPPQQEAISQVPSLLILNPPPTQSVFP